MSTATAFRPPIDTTATPRGLAARQADEARWQSREWKAGYQAARRHRALTVLGVVTALLVLARRHRFPVGVVVVWLVLAALCLWPITATVVVLEVRRHRRVNAALAMTHRDDPFPAEDGSP